jgi:hypothetical protein
MKIRRFTAEGLSQFGAYLGNLRADHQLEPPFYLLADPNASESIDVDGEVENKPFAARFEAAAYLSEKLATTGIQDLDRDAGLWAWLTLFYFDQLCPAAKGGARKVGELARYIPLIETSRRYYRHMLMGPVMMYRAHIDRPNRLLALLSNPMSVATSETYRLFIENPTLIACRAVVDVATWLYYDSARGKLKRGAGSKDAGGCRRLVEYLQQIDCTYDLPIMTKDRLSGMLPSEFRRFVPKQLELQQ